MLIVQKYGGTSVSSIERIQAVATHIAATRRNGHALVVVVSAMAGETDRLLSLVNQITSSLLAPAPQGRGNAEERESDTVVTTGEQVSAGLVALAIEREGVPAISLLAHQIPIITDGIFCRSRIQWIHAETIRAALNEGKVIVIPGFQGVDVEGNLTTLGRGGSDTTAVAVAAALHADACEIYTDVDGVYTADPNTVPKAQKLDRIAYEEFLEMAGAGAKVMQMRAVQLAARYNVPLHIRSAIDTDRTGTTIVREDSRLEVTLVSGVTYTVNEAKIAVRRVPDRPGIAARLFDPLAKANINVDMIVQTIDARGQSDIGFTVTKEDLKKTLQITEAAAKEIGAQQVEAAGDVSKISIIGVGMRSHAGVAARLFDILAREGINIQLTSTSEIKVSVVVDMVDSKRVVRALHHAFGLDGAD